MQLGNTRVWDYVGDNFVHRLLQNNEDGKLVEVEGNSSGRRQQSGKLHMQIVFTLLSIQLFYGIQVKATTWNTKKSWTLSN